MHKQKQVYIDASMAAPHAMLGYSDLVLGFIVEL